LYQTMEPGSISREVVSIFQSMKNEKSFTLK
jgi:hypothetical protein